jgi:hypothetical protein
MVHQSQGLAFGFESRDNSPGVHAKLNYFESHSTPNWLLLLGHVDGPAASFPNLLQNFVAPYCFGIFCGMKFTYDLAFQKAAPVAKVTFNMRRQFGSAFGACAFHRHKCSFGGVSC